MLSLKSTALIITITLLNYTYLSAQSRWTHVYHDEIDAPLEYFIESYDHGYLLSGKIGANYSKYNWLIKTDINGEILWEKTIGDGINAIAFHDMAQDSLGAIFLSGGTHSYDPEGDPLIMKLDPCGEKEWCRIFYTENHNDYSNCLALTPKGEIVSVLNLTNPDYSLERICLAKLTSDGGLVWRQCYRTSDTNLQDEFSNELICTPDQGFLVSGYCYYQDPTDTNHWILHPYILKVDSSGNFQWETVIYKDTNLDGGSAWNTVVSPDGKYYYSSLSHYLFDDGLRSPALAKLDLQGNVVGVYDVVSDYKNGFLLSVKFLNESTLAAEASWGNTEDEAWARAVIIDTLGNLLNSSVINQDIYGSILQITYDGKLVYGSNTSYPNGQFDCFLTKLNQNLQDDTIYTRPFTYDSLCPYQIVSDTIVQDDCELIVGIEEHDGGEAGVHGSLEIWPNPANEQIHVRCTMYDGRFNRDLALVIYDIYGRIAISVTLPPVGGRAGDGGWQDWTMDVSSLPPGIYILVFKDEKMIRATAKFVIARK